MKRITLEFFCDECGNKTPALSLIVIPDLTLHVTGFCQQCQINVQRSYDLITLAVQQEAA